MAVDTSSGCPAWQPLQRGGDGVVEPCVDELRVVPEEFRSTAGHSPAKVVAITHLIDQLYRATMSLTISAHSCGRLTMMLCPLGSDMTSTGAALRIIRSWRGGHSARSAVRRR